MNTYEPALHPNHNPINPSIVADRNEYAVAERVLATGHTNPYINMAAFENVVSPTANALLSSVYAGRYVIGNHNDHDFEKTTSASGLTRQNYPDVVFLEKQTAAYFKKNLNAKDVEIRPLSGMHAVMTTILTLTKLGDTIVSIDPLEGGHFATKNLADGLGRHGIFLKFDPITCQIDIAESAENLQKANMIFLDPGILRYPVNLTDLRKVAPYTKIVYDASHVLGLIINNLFQNPFVEGVDVIQANTHKSFPGPIRAIIASADYSVSDSISNAMSTMMVSHSNTGSLLALGQTTLEMEKYGKLYAEQMIKNAQVLEKHLRGMGFDVFQSNKKPTESHIILVRNPNSEGIAKTLIDSGLAVNARSFLGEPFLRIGVQEITRRGFKEESMRQISEIFYSVANGLKTDKVSKMIRKLAAKHNTIEYC